ncbi:hypothetical protein PVAND_016656 [Polypedilum vanderplanki]|uniref:F-box domain-containing protein n=1 Tax=Polypedilum vanderplanki TaxID=319348 RepID=A0A9J6BFR2_POLVA|nr:hypothetical protein PVAND_016656 [Polypedilum vanderplanki]
MSKLPEEIWREIFQYLGARDLLNLTRVSRKFREIVNTSQSLAAKLTLCFEKRKRNSYIGRRRYRKLNVGYIDVSVHYNILRFVGSDITQLTFSYYNFKLDSIRQVLMLCSNVKTLRFKEIQHLHGVADVGSNAAVPCYKNCEIEVVQCDPRIFKILKGCRAKKVHFTCCEFAHRHYFLDFLSFMSMQEDLSHFILEEFFGPCVGLGLVLFNNDILANTKFRLKSLTMKSNQLSPYGHISSVQFFEQFMNNQIETLEELEADQLHDFDFTAYLQQCKKIKNLNVGIDMRLSSKQFLSEVTKVEVEQPRMNLLRCFPNVTEVKILNTYYDPQRDIVKWNLLTKCNFIHKLIIEDVSLDDFPSLPSLKCLQLEFYINVDSKIFARNPQLEEVTFIECRDMRIRKSKVLKIIVDYLKDLRSLTIVTSSKVDPSALQYVKQKCPKLKYLKVFKDLDCEILWN